MSSRPFDQTNSDLERQLTELGSQLAWAPTPDLVAAVAGATHIPTPLPSPHHRRRWLAAAAIALLLVAAVLAGSSSIRSTVADFLGIDGLRIERGEPETTPTSLPNLGTPTSMQDFQRWLPFTPMQPAGLGSPNSIYIRILENGDVLGIMAWEPSDTLPRTAETNLGALLMQFDAPDEPVMMLKTVGLSTGTVTDTFVDGSRAWWVEGASALTIYESRSTETRPTGNVLIWQQGNIGYRFESALTMDEAIAIAESMQPTSQPS